MKKPRGADRGETCERESKEFQVGDRVRLREIDRKNSKTPERRGNIVGRAGTQSWRVLWSGRKTDQIVHCSHLKRWEKEDKEDQEPG
jgi:hypothetical protein